MKLTRLPVATVVAAALFGTAVETRAQYVPGPPPPYYPPNPYQDQYVYDYGNPMGPFYMGVDLGVSIVQNTRVRNAPPASLSFEPGIRADFTFGYQIPSTLLAIEFETGTTWNSLTSGGFLTPPGWDANLYQIPFLGNLVLNVPLRNFTLYVGAGAGGVASELDVSAYGGTLSDTDVTFAYQGKAGVKYAFTPNMEVDLGYKFLGTASHTWFRNDIFLTSTDPIYSHSVLASFNWRF